jgi:hypothetical protein
MLTEEASIRLFDSDELSVNKAEALLIHYEDIFANNYQKLMKKQSLAEQKLMGIEEKQFKDLLRLEKKFRALRQKQFYREEAQLKDFIRKEKQLAKNEERFMLTQEQQTKYIISEEKKRILREQQEKLKKEEEIRRRVEAEALKKQKEEEELVRQQELARKREEERIESERLYQEALRKIEEQKALELERIEFERRRQLELEEEEKSKYNWPTPPSSPDYIAESPLFDPSEEALIRESQLIESMELVCGSFFCVKCYRMLKRSSLFLKCSACCDKAFLEPIPKPNYYEKPSLPANALCVGCNEEIAKGELVRCICCYLKHEFLKVPASCGMCFDPEMVNWVDTYTGSKYEMINCGFCERRVNYAYVIEVCTNCHDQICLHCLRKNAYIGFSICNECHSRREVNPFKRPSKKATKKNAIAKLID